MHMNNRSGSTRRNAEGGSVGTCLKDLRQQAIGVTGEQAVDRGVGALKGFQSFQRQHCDHAGILDNCAAEREEQHMAEDAAAGTFAADHGQFHTMAVCHVDQEESDHRPDGKMCVDNCLARREHDVTGDNLAPSARFQQAGAAFRPAT